MKGRPWRLLSKRHAAGATSGAMRESAARTSPCAKYVFAPPSIGREALGLLPLAGAEQLACKRSGCPEYRRRRVNRERGELHGRSLERIKKITGRDAITPTWCDKAGRPPQRSQLRWPCSQSRAVQVDAPAYAVASSGRSRHGPDKVPASPICRSRLGSEAGPRFFRRIGPCEVGPPSSCPRALLATRSKSNALRGEIYHRGDVIYHSARRDKNRSTCALSRNCRILNAGTEGKTKSDA